MNATTHEERLALRNASTLAQAQAAYDDAAEPEGDPRAMAAEDARSIAESECLSTGYDLAYSMAQLADVAGPVDVDAMCVHGFDACGKSADVLIAVLMHARKLDDIIAARTALMEMIEREASMREAIERRAAAVQAEGWTE